MATSNIEQDWNVEKENLKQRFARLTNDDLLLGESQNDEMFLRLQIKLGKTKEELHKLLADLLFISYFHNDPDEQKIS